MKKTLGLFVFCMAMAVFFINGASGEEAKYPAKPIQVVIPYPPGGTNDIIARIVNGQLQETLKVSIIHLNKVGGSGITGVMAVKEERPDGYTILQGGSTVVIDLPIITPNCPYTREDFIPIARTVVGQNALLVKKDAPWNDLESFIADAKKQPGKISLAIPGVGTGQHLVTTLLEKDAGIELNIIPFKGDSASIVALLGNHVQTIMAGMTAATPYLQSGEVRALASTGYERHPGFKDIPLFKEKGYPEVIMTNWGGPFVRSGTPDSIIKILDKAYQEAANHPSVQALLIKAGITPAYLGSEELKKRMPGEYERALKASKLAGVIK